MAGSLANRTVAGVTRRDLDKATSGLVPGAL